MSVRIICGDALDQLRLLPDESVHCCVTSPPYFGLRDYGTAEWDGGDAGCDHVSFEKPPVIGSSSTLGFPADGGPRRIAEGNTYHEGYKRQFQNACAKCGARRIDRQIGLEPSPDEYVAALVAVFREVRRVLRKHGTLWLNIGDSYCSIGHKKSSSGYGTTGLAGGKAQEHHPLRRENNVAGLKHKDLIGIPWLLAFALRNDGWWLRSEIIWSKPNPMPESVTDRPTKAHEYLFLLTKAERYYYDADAISEPFADERMGNPGAYKRTTAKERKADLGFLNNGNGWNADGAAASRNKRSVWTVATAPYSEAHFATFPPALIDPCILAGCPEGGTVLDPFGGAGTTGLVADRLRRNALVIELNPAYAEMARRRIRGDAPLLTEVA